jgi:hypothetical protein
VLEARSSNLFQIEIDVDSGINKDDMLRIEMYLKDDNANIVDSYGFYLTIEEATNKTSFNSYLKDGLDHFVEFLEKNARPLPDSVHCCTKTKMIFDEAFKSIQNPVKIYKEEIERKYKKIKGI